MIVDANVFKGFYQVDIGKAHSLCGCPAALMGLVTPNRPVYHDDGGVLEHEWGAVVDRDWFEAWYSASLVSGIIKFCHAPKNLQLEKQIQGLGFPGGRDAVYIRVALKVVSIEKSCTFYTEDLDFYNPKLKGCPAVTRVATLKSGTGPVSKILAKHDISVSCVP